MLLLLAMSKIKKCYRCLMAAHGTQYTFDVQPNISSTCSYSVTGKETTAFLEKMHL